MTENYEDWHIKILEAEERGERKVTLLPYQLYKATEKQHEALTRQAQDWGFKDLRGFAEWMRQVDVTYYDVIKVASP
jgi:hypothetical protein